MAKSQSELSTVKGVGPATRKKLEDAGIKTVAALKKESAESIADKTKLSKAQADNIVSAAAKIQTSKKKATKKTSTKKKTTKKKATKKASTKKSSQKKTSTVSGKDATKAAANAMRDIIARARDHFKRAPRQHVFVLHSGEELKDLFELAQKLEDIADHVFAHHVNDERHDFASWVQHVLDEHALADQLRNARKHPEDQQRIIYRHITRRVW